MTEPTQVPMSERGRPIRTCPLCGQTDDHPRHVQDVPRPDGGVLTLPVHHDCCAAQGCQTCVLTELENEGRRGDDLVEHLTALYGS